MEVKGWAAGTMWRLEEVSKFLICVCINVVFVGLAEEETASWRGLEEFRR